MYEERIKKAEQKTNTNPTKAQKESGNYKKGKVIIKGMQITIENPVGSIRSGVDKNGDSWEIKMPYAYGYFNRTKGKDGDQVDVYLGNHFKDFDIFIIDQVDQETKAFDEHKVMFGFESKEEAKQAYLDCYKKEWKGFGCITKISLNKFKVWLNDGSINKYPASKLNMISKMDVKNVNSDTEEIVHKIRLFGEVEADKTLKDLIKQTGDINKFDTLVVEIASPGGSVSEGLEIMSWLDLLSSKGKKIITVVVANAYSIASLIMLSANIKLISKHGKVMVHNPMVPELKYVNANEMEKHIEDLRELEEAMYELYELFTGLNRETIKDLMDEETYLSPQEAVDYGFADMVVNIKPKSFEMTTNTNKKINMSNTINSIKKAIAMVNQSEYVNQTYTEIGGGSEIEIFQNDPSSYMVGDRTNLEEGVITLSDGAKLTIKDFIITDIDRSVEPEENEGETIVENPEGETIIETQEEASFNEGEAPKQDIVEEPSVEKPVEEIPAKVIEKTEQTVTTKEVQNVDQVEAKVEEVEAKVEEAEAKVEEEAENKVENVDMSAKIESLEAKNKELEAKLINLEAKLDKESKATDEKMESVSKFEETAAKAFETIAKNMSSDFKPEAKVIVGEAAKGSIFQQLKKKRGL